MKRLFFLLFIFFGYCFVLHAQKIKVISVFKLIETDKYEEAKKNIEEAINEEKTSHWYRTWYARGLLCQTAYQKGMKEKDKKKYELYPDQLYVAFDSYEKALSLDARGRLDAQLAPMYVLLANDLQKLGEKHYNGKEYKDALKAFELALNVIQSPILSIGTDTSLVYNAALAAYACKEWDKAIGYLNGLHEDTYSTNASHLLFSAYLEKGDTISAERVLMEGADRYEDNEDLVLLLVDLLFQKNDTEKIVSILDSASLKSPSKYIFHYTKGLIYQKIEQYKKAIDAYEEALKLAPEESKIFANIGTCYYNSGVEIEENARTITNNRSFLEEKAKSAEAFESAVHWFEKAYETNPEDQSVIMKLNQLYNILRKSDKIRILEERID